MKELEKIVLTSINGGSTCPSYEVTDNYNAAIYQTKIVSPYAVGLALTYWRDVLKFIFL